jgi:hypothetical protein
MRSHTLISLVAVVAVSLLTAGCGGGATTAAASGQNGLVAYSHCMRSHGLPTFPDPTGNDGIPKDKVPLASPQFGVASKDCQHLIPVTGLGPQTTPQQTHTRVADEIAFAACLRTHGFPNFPDPTAGGELTRQMLANARIDLHQPALVQAADACVGVSHGVFTKADVARFIAGG